MSKSEIKRINVLKGKPIMDGIEQTMKTASEKVKTLLATMNLNGLGGYKILKTEDEILSIVAGLERNKQTYEEHLIERIAERDTLRKRCELLTDKYVHHLDSKCGSYGEGYRCVCGLDTVLKKVGGE